MQKKICVTGLEGAVAAWPPDSPLGMPLLLGKQGESTSVDITTTITTTILWLSRLCLGQLT